VSAFVSMASPVVSLTCAFGKATDS